MDIHKHLPKSVNASRLWRHSREILANQNCERWWDVSCFHFVFILAAQMSSIWVAYIVHSARKPTKRDKACRLSKLYLELMWMWIWIPDNWEGDVERGTSIRNEAFYFLNLYWYLTLLLKRPFAKKFGQNSYLRMHAETSLPIAVSRLKTPLRFLTSLI